MKNLLWNMVMLDSSLGGNLNNEGEWMKFFKENVWGIVKTILWILVAVMAVVFIIKAVTTALAVMKAADEPQVRQEKLGAFKYLAIGLGVAIVVVSMAAIIFDLIINSGDAGDPTAFLF